MPSPPAQHWPWTLPWGAARDRSVLSCWPGAAAAEVVEAGVAAAVVGAVVAVAAAEVPAVVGAEV
ncbi:MAG: hypothetical protein NTW83_13500, partial [Cyanobacteria bacterium]|nr:hypothetical protein [Cyanobacteriota bacterium]